MDTGPPHKSSHIAIIIIMCCCRTLFLFRHARCCYTHPHQPRTTDNLQSHMNASTQTNKYIYIYTRVHARTHTHAHTHTYVCTCAHARTRMPPVLSNVRKHTPVCHVCLSLSIMHCLSVCLHTSPSPPPPPLSYFFTSLSLSLFLSLSVSVSVCAVCQCRGHNHRLSLPRAESSREARLPQLDQRIQQKWPKVS